ncbi:MAG: methionyl-tRNA formyltransferase [Phycisphaerae bacterium]|nr:methionyl-tRNA formyltransferase [Phycisphaerae bacterium]
MKRLRLVYFGAGAFGIPTLEALADAHDVALVVTQPDRPSGRGRSLTPTPIARWASEHSLKVGKPVDANVAEEIAAIRAAAADAYVVIAFGQKMSAALLADHDGKDVFAINLHASLLPAYRGAAPINWAIIDGCAVTGISVIALAQRMDAGVVYQTSATPIDPLETAGELHDRLAKLGPDAVLETLDRFSRGVAIGAAQDALNATKARKLSKEDGRIDLATLSATAARCRVHGLSPWPGCDVLIEGAPVRLLRVRDYPDSGGDAAPPGTVLADGRIACATGELEIVELQPQGGRPMTLREFRNGRRFAAGMLVAAVESKESAS